MLVFIEEELVNPSEHAATPSFTDLQLIDPLLRSLGESGYTHPTPIQVQSIPYLLVGSDLLGCAQTGTGKTAAFALPILQRLAEKPRRLERKQTRVLILTPTRELAIQILESFRTYGKYLRLKACAIFGGVGQNPQVQAMAQGVDVLVATPGRLLDLMNQRHVSLSGLEVFVLDEADRMLDMGFIHDVKRIIEKLPYERQNLFFSATMPPEVVKLASGLLTNPHRVEVTPQATTAEKIDQSVLFVDKKDKKSALKNLLENRKLSKVIVFTRTKHGANNVSEVLEKNGIASAAIHGNKSQGARQRALEDFKSGKVRVLVATDIAARGIDVDGITHVINFELPNIAESYVHRIGRTARAGAEGQAISLCDIHERAFLKDIEKMIGMSIPVNSDHPHHSEETANAKPLSKGKAKALLEAEGRSGDRNRPPRHRKGFGRPRGEGTSSSRNSRNKPQHKASPSR